jgi:hypothetical protein
VNAAYYVNKVLGIAFGAVLLALAGYKAWEWRNAAADEAGKRLQRRIEQISEQTREDMGFDRQPEWAKLEFDASQLHGFGGVSLPQSPPRH